jgi:hypothetical protein
MAMLGNAAASRDSSQAEPAVEVRDNDSYKGVFATADIAGGSVIFQLRGTISPRPSKYTIQIDDERHLGAPAIVKAKDKLDYCWKYLNHSCEPNGFINVSDLTFIALTDIAAGAEITFNYLTTESAMDVPFNCRCGSSNCFGFIRGRKFLTEEEIDRLTSAIGKTIK